MRIPKEQIQKTRAQQETDIVQCLKVLSAGGLILYPTDTVWGIGCDATNAEAVKRVYQLKQRDDSKALIVLIDSAEHLDHYVVDVPMIAQELIDVAVKPLTIIYEGAYNLAPKGQRGHQGAERRVLPPVVRAFRQAHRVHLSQRER